MVPKSHWSPKVTGPHMSLVLKSHWSPKFTGLQKSPTDQAYCQKYNYVANLVIKKWFWKF